MFEIVQLTLMRRSPFSKIYPVFHFSSLYINCSGTLDFDETWLLPAEFDWR
jgi:hypothetical protein